MCPYPSSPHFIFIYCLLHLMLSSPHLIKCLLFTGTHSVLHCIGQRSHHLISSSFNASCISVLSSQEPVKCISFTGSNGVFQSFQTSLQSLPQDKPDAHDLLIGTTSGDCKKAFEGPQSQSLHKTCTCLQGLGCMSF